MANYTANTAVHENLTASSVDNVTLSQVSNAVTVVNRTGTSEIYVTYANGSSNNANPPTVGGNNCLVVPAALCALTFFLGEATGATISLISAGTMAYSVEALS